jgi:hypothetical protein
MAGMPRQGSTEAYSIPTLPTAQAVEAILQDVELLDVQKALLFCYFCDNPDMAAILPVTNVSFCSAIFKDILGRSQVQ